MKVFTELMSYDEIKDFLGYESPYKMARMMVDKLTPNIMISRGYLYVLQDNNTYNGVEANIDDSLLTYISIFICNSIEKLTSDQDKLLRLEASTKKSYLRVQQNNTVKTYLPQLKTLLDHHVQFNYTPMQIHFRNGYIDIKDKGVFKKRTEPFYITQYIDRDYKKSTKADRLEVQKTLRKIYPDKKDRESVLYYFGSTLSWESSVNTKGMLFCLGKANSGKSIALKLYQEALPPYFKELTSDSFSNKASSDKVINTFYEGPQFLMIWINEMCGNKINMSIFKGFVEGECNTTKLYKEGSHSFRHNGFVVATSNEIPSLIWDSGALTRVNAITHKSQFVNDRKKVDEEQNVYLGDSNFIKTLTDGFKNGYVDILVRYCKRWIEGGHKVPENENSKLTKGMMQSNDTVQDFIDSQLILTGNEEDRIGKNVMREAYLSANKDKHLSILQLITSLKDKGMRYECDYRKNNIRGCFVGVQFKDSDNDDDISAYEEISRLKEQIRKLQAEVKKPVKKPSKKTSKKPVKKLQSICSQKSLQLQLED